MPIYDPKIDNGDETDPKGLRLPGVRRNNPDGSFDVDYDIPLALYDCRLDDGKTPHKDAHNGNGESHPEWWGKTFFRHFPNHGFVGDIFTVNGTAYPVMQVKRRKYRLRFLDASIARCYELWLMHSSKGPQAARDARLQGRRAAGPVPAPRRHAVHADDADRQRGRAAAEADRARLVRDVAGEAPRGRRRLHQVHGRHADQAGRRDLPRQHDEDEDRPHVGLRPTRTTRCRS